jgi:formylglycine-generating enzyme required for sulfatase activity
MYTYILVFVSIVLLTTVTYSEDRTITKKEKGAGAASHSTPSKEELTGGSGGKSYTDTATGMGFVFVKGGCYQMGDRDGDGRSNEKPVHEVCVSDFWIGKYRLPSEAELGVCVPKRREG